ncbi:MAG: hypothetical protein WCA08_03375 [Desulfoferrobacter sp.]
MSIRWTVSNHYGNEIYLTHERWNHIIEPINHPEMADFEEHLKQTIWTGTRKQDSLNPRKYRYVKMFEDLPEENTHIVAIVLFRFKETEVGRPVPNNYIVTAYQKEIG